MIYSPSRNPTEVFILISVICAVGIVGSVFFSVFFAVAALIFWIHYTAVLSYLQFSRKHRHKIKGITTFLLNPQFRFFIFVFIAVIGLFSVFYTSPLIAYVSLGAWWLFSLNFYRHYRQFRQ